MESQTNDGPSLLSGYLNLEELAAELHRSPRTIERWLTRRERPI